ncbi:MAG: TadE/TadG family type IV pilus assembly protein [Negativicutes bacterium]|nr:TadE/TadG family type IV pilus assembly protein [Negativicutes bacterium]
MQMISKYVRNHRGQSMVEFALVLPVLLLMVVGMIAFGIVIHDYLAMAEAARVGARYAIVHPEATDGKIQDIARAAVPTYTNPQPTVTTLPAQSQRTSGATVTVTATYPRKVDVTTVDPKDISKTVTLLPATQDGVLITGQAIMMME